MTTPIRLSPSGPYLDEIGELVQIQEDGIALGAVDTINFVGIPTDVTASTATVSGLTTQVARSVSGVVNQLSLAGVKNRDTVALTATGDVELNGIDSTDIPTGFEFVLSLGTAAPNNVTINDQSDLAVEADKIEPPFHLPYLMNEDEDLIVRRTATRWTFAAANRIPASVEPYARLISRDDFSHLAIDSATVTAGTTVRLFTADGIWAITAVTADGTVALGTPQSGNPGVLSLTTGAVNGASLTIYQGLQGDATAGSVFASDLWLQRLIAQLPSSANVCLRFGLASNAITPTTANDGIFWVYDTAVDTTLRLFCRSGGSQSVATVSGTSLTTMFQLEAMQAIAGRITGRKNNTSISAPITTNVPTAIALVPFVQVITRTGATKALSIDMTTFASRGLDRI